MSMHKLIVLGLLIFVALLGACSSQFLVSQDFSSPEQTLDTLSRAAELEDAQTVYASFSSLYWEEQGLNFSLVEQFFPYERWHSLAIQNTAEAGSVYIIVLETGERLFFIEEEDNWVIRNSDR